MRNPGRSLAFCRRKTAFGRRSRPRGRVARTRQQRRMSPERPSDAAAGEDVSVIRPANRFLAAALAAACVLGGLPERADADPIADFYKGKTLTVLIGVGVGGE